MVLKYMGEEVDVKALAAVENMTEAEVIAKCEGHELKNVIFPVSGKIYVAKTDVKRKRNHGNKRGKVVLYDQPRPKEKNKQVVFKCGNKIKDIHEMIYAYRLAMLYTGKAWKIQRIETADGIYYPELQDKGYITHNFELIVDIDGNEYKNMTVQEVCEKFNFCVR